jgi:hypothetical protein
MKRIIPILAAGLLGLSMGAVHAKAIVPLPPRPPGPAPVGWVYRYVQPVYTTVTERIWVPERIDWVSEWAWVDGRYQQVYRQVVRPGHFETTTRRVLISPGYWQLVRADVVPMPVPLPRPIPVVGNPGTVGVEGYHTGPGEDLSRFSPLTEWPK